MKVCLHYTTIDDHNIPELLDEVLYDGLYDVVPVEVEPGFQVLAMGKSQMTTILQ